MEVEDILKLVKCVEERETSNVVNEHRVEAVQQYCQSLQHQLLTYEVTVVKVHGTSDWGLNIYHYEELVIQKNFSDLAYLLAYLRHVKMSIVSTRELTDKLLNRLQEKVKEKEFTVSHSCVFKEAILLNVEL